VLLTEFLLREKIFDNIWIQPAAGDAGGALGAALSAWHLHHYKSESKVSTHRDSMKGSYLGPEFSDSEIEAELICMWCKVYKKLSRRRSY
jgi:carbamoyltransferase